MKSRHAIVIAVAVISLSAESFAAPTAPMRTGGGPTAPSAPRQVAAPQPPARVNPPPQPPAHANPPPKPIDLRPVTRIDQPPPTPPKNVVVFPAGPPPAAAPANPPPTNGVVVMPTPTGGAQGAAVYRDPKKGLTGYGDVRVEPGVPPSGNLGVIKETP
jgi:hypothetical protein